MTIYHLGKIEWFLLPVIFPAAKLIAAKPASDTAKKILAKIPTNETEFAYHLDVSFSDTWPPFRAELNAALRARGIRIYNAHVTSLGRKKLQAAVAKAGLPCLNAKRSGKANEKLIAKPDFNYRGLLDIEWNAKHPALFPKVPTTLKDFVIKPRCEIPAHWWDAEDVQIERYVSNPENKYFRAIFWANRVIVAKYINPNAIKKASTSIARWRFPGTTRNKEIAPVVKVTRKIFKQTGFDFGTLDILSDADGNLFPCDLNSTPYWGPSSNKDKNIWTPDVVVRYLRDGTMPENGKPKSLSGNRSVITLVPTRAAVGQRA